ncbi:MAG: family ATPase [Frankiales bacterium]|nr:family ATPase [Frankiales bacterium]
MLRRILVAGTSGSGKTTTAQRLSERLGLPHTEIDALFHGPDWVPRPSFAADVDAFSREPAWVTEWQYSSMRPLLLDRADTLVWLHFRRTTVMWRLIRRTIRRRVRRIELWNGNLEPPLRMFFIDRDHVVRWGWRTHSDRIRLVRESVAAKPELHVVEVRNQRQLDRWIATL